MPATATRRPETAVPDGGPRDAVDAARLPVGGADAEPAAASAPGRPVLLVRDDGLLAALGQALELAADEIVIRRMPSALREPIDAPRALLVRPDGRVAWTAPADGPIAAALDVALRAVGFPLPETASRTAAPR